MKNTQSKTMSVNSPYEVWQSFDGSWTWRILKKWQSPDKEAGNEYARWFCAVKTPMTGNSYDIGDVYVSEIKRNAVKVENPVLDKW
jgi:hypothetical protein